jgi:glycosyltransferase involved in cell wall biosynthesis
MSSSRLRVSIVIPAHNEERHLWVCLEAIAAQSHPVHEVVVVDNNSTDRTRAVAESFPFVKVISESEQGIVFARNQGFTTATGDIIGRIDADILLPADWVAHVQSFYSNPKNQRKAWTGAPQFYNVRMRRLVSVAYSLFAFRMNKLLIGHYSLWGSNMAMTREQWQDVRTSICPRTDIHEDLDLAMHLHKKGYDIMYDTSVRANAELRRVHSDHHKLWSYLEWWPRTLKVHGYRNWPVCWFFGVFVLYYATFILIFADKVMRLFRRQINAVLEATR